MFKSSFQRGPLGGLLTRHFQDPVAHRAMAAPRPSVHRERATFVTTATAASDYNTDKTSINIYTDYTVYKTKGAMSMKLIKPTWDKAGSSNSLKMVRSGTVLLEFANARGEREYDWEKKETFALSAVECAEVLETVEANAKKDFFHDPNKNTASEGSVTKTLRLTPVERGYFVNLTVNQKASGVSSTFFTSLNSAELRVIRNVMDYAIPRILGFDEMFAAAPTIQGSFFGSQQGGAPTQSNAPF